MTNILHAARELLAAGQPSPGQLAALAGQGVRTVINLLPGGEPLDFDEAAVTAGLGMHYVVLPISGAADLTPANIARFSVEMARARARGGVLVHCASGNRAGALIALDRGITHGDDSDSALALGRAAGLAGLEPVVASLLQDRPSPLPTPQGE